MVNHTGRARRGIAVMDPGIEIPAGNEVMPQESQKSCSVWYREPDRVSDWPAPQARRVMD